MKRAISLCAVLLLTLCTYRLSGAGAAIVPEMAPLSGRADTASFRMISATQTSVEAGSFRARGSVYLVNGQQLVIATVRHLFDDASGISGEAGKCRVVFPDGTDAEAELLGASEDADIAFATVALDALSAETLQAVATVRTGRADAPAAGESVLLTGGGDDMRIGSVAYPSLYVASAGGDMLCCYCETESGMSGCGVFDLRGNLVGVLSMGSSRGQMLAVTADQVTLAYQTLQNKW